MKENFLMAQPSEVPKTSLYYAGFGIRENVDKQGTDWTEWIRLVRLET